MRKVRPVTAGDWLARRRVAVPRGIASSTAIMAERARNAEIWDTEGRRYIDFASGIGVLAIGHCHPAVTDAVTEQLRAFTHTAFQVMGYADYIRLAEVLNERAPFEEAAQTLLMSTGAEAVENAVKIARMVTGRSGVIAFTGAFHGRTLLTMGLTGKVAPNKKGYGAITVDVHRCLFPVPHQGVSVEDALNALDTLFYSDADPEGIAAILIEPVQGEGGFNVAPAEFLARLRELCDAHGILLIVDEIQSGGGRTGRFFAVEHAGVEPDLVTMAKALGGGLPISAVIGRARIMDQIEPGGFGSTYGGSPVACAAALAVLEVVAKENLIARAIALGARMRERFDAWASSGSVRNVRGLGAMLGFDLAGGGAARRVVARALGKGLLALTCGRNSETIRMLVPLTIEEAVLDEGLHILEQSLREESRA